MEFGLGYVLGIEADDSSFCRRSSDGSSRERLEESLSPVLGGSVYQDTSSCPLTACKIVVVKPRDG